MGVGGGPSMTVEAWNPLHGSTRDGEHWTTANVGEALPGVLTPLGWTLWGETIEDCVRHVFCAMGAFPARERAVPREGDRIIRIFHGRPALLVELLARLGDCMPGTTGAQVVAGVFGDAPDDIVYRPTRRRYPFIALGLTREFLTIEGRLGRAVATTEPWWEAEVGRIPGLDRAGAVAAFAGARKRFRDNVLLQTTALFCAVQPMFDALARLTAKAGVGDAPALTGGYGNVPETVLVADLWRASRGEVDKTEVVRRHGFHGPMEGELSARVWREDPGPLHRLMAEYAARPDSDDPRHREAVLRSQRQQLERALLDEVPRAQRPLVRALLRRAAVAIPLRGVAKRAFLQAFDVARASARRAGECLAADGLLAGPEDVFYLTVEELTGGIPANAQDLVTRRRTLRAEYERVRLPTHWTGEVVPIPVDAAAPGPDVSVVSGTGVSPGLVEGRARVVTDPAFGDVAPGEILVSPTTDPSWAAIMFISEGLVVDIGGALSHAAVVARELGIPCVVNTVHGSRTIRTGDRIRVDGTAGTVEILIREGSTDG